MPTSGQPPAPKVNVALKIETMVQISDTGYLGEGATVQEHIDHANEQLRAWRWFVQKGGTEPVPVQVRPTLIGVTILPQEPT